MILRGIFHVLSRFPLHFMLYRGNLDYLSNSVEHVLYYVRDSIGCLPASGKRACNIDYSWLDNHVTRGHLLAR